MKTTWVVVADAARARILASESKMRPFEDIEQMVHGEARLRGTERNTDRQGRSFDSHGQGRHAMEARVDHDEQEAIRFAADIADRLEKGRQNGEFDELVLVAPPRFLGHLRKSIDDDSAARIRAQVDKELSQLDDEEIRRRLQDHL